MNLNFLNRFSKNTWISSFMEIRPVGAELLHADRRTDRHDEGNSRFFRNFTNSPTTQPVNAV